MSSTTKIDPLDREAAPATWPVGLFVHTWDEQDRIRYQGQVKSRDADGKLWVQLFSFMDGSSTKVEAIDPATTKVTYYPTNGAMLDAYDAYCQHIDPKARVYVGDGREFAKFMREPK